MGILVIYFISSLIATTETMQLGEIVDEFHRIYNFQTILYFIPNVTKQEQVTIFDQINLLAKDIPVLCIRSPANNDQIWKVVPKIILSIVFFTESNRETALKLLDNTFQHFFRPKIIFDFHTVFPGQVDLETLCIWLGRGRMVYSLILANNQMFTFDLYPTMSIKKVTSLTPLQILFAEKVKGFHGATMKVVNDQSMLTYINLTDQNGQTRYGGHALKAIQTFIQKYNGTFQMLHWELTDSIDKFNIHPVTPLGMEGVSEITYPYPRKFCVITPYQKEVPRMFYLSLPFKKFTWSLLLVGLLILFLSEILADILYGNDRDIFSIQNAFFHALRIFTQQLHFQKRLRNIPCLSLVHLLAIFLVMLMTSLYQSVLSALYTKSIPGVQVDSLDDLAKSGHKILMYVPMYDLSLELNLFPSNVLRTPSENDPSIEMFQLNRSFAYFMPTIVTDAMIEIQNCLKVKYFHRSLCTFDMRIGIVVERNFPLKEVLDDVLFRLREAGIISKWKVDFTMEAYEAGYLRFKQPNESNLRPLQVNELVLIWLLYGIGISVSSILFCFEKYLKFRINRLWIKKNSS